MSMGVMLKNAQVAQGSDNRLILGFTEAMHKGYFDQESHRQELEKSNRSPYWEKRGGCSYAFRRTKAGKQRIFYSRQS